MPKNAISSRSAVIKASTYIDMNKELTYRTEKNFGYFLGRVFLSVIFISSLTVAHSAWAQEMALFEEAGMETNSAHAADWVSSQLEERERGVQPFLGYTGEFFSVLDGGNETATTWQGLADFGADFYLENLVGIPGALVHIHGQTIHGDDPSAFAGDINALSNIVAFNTSRLFQLWYEQELMEGSMAIRVGLIDLDDDFMIADSSGLFINSGFGPMPTQSLNNAAPIWPIGALGALLYAEPSENTFIQMGIYDGNIGDEEINDDGLHVKLGGVEGFLYMFETGVTSNILGREGVYKIGGFYHSGEEFIDFNTGNTVNGNSSIYFAINQELSDSFTGWWRLGYSPDAEKNVVSLYTDFGINWIGPFGQRSEDILGIGFLHTDFSDDYVRANPGVSSTESVLELTYQGVITPWFTLQPDLQIIFNPHEGEKDAIVFGIRSQIIF